MINILSKQNIFFTALAQFQDIRSYLRDVNTFRAVKLTTNVLYYRFIVFKQENQDKALTHGHLYNRVEEEQ